MGGKGAAPPSSPSGICCMCGDYGLPRELFRCKLCLFRSQHKYCSDLYPKAETYRACNWCLREDGGKSLARESIAENNNNSISSSTSGSGGGGGGGGGGGVLGSKLHRGAFASHLNKPIKKQRVAERSEELSASLGRARQAFRGKVRRYKLLEEVSS